MGETMDRYAFSPDPLQPQPPVAGLDEAAALLAARYEQAPLAYVHSYGCQQNVSDGEHIQGLLARMGFGFTDELALADLVLYNTCAVRESAQDRVYGNIGALKSYKKAKPGLLIVLCGCMTQQPTVMEKIRKSYPYVDIVMGTNALHRLPQLLLERLQGGKRSFLRLEEVYIPENIPARREGGVKAWLPIMQGCDNFCSYCIVPYVRGRETSRRPEAVLAEAREILAQGYKEITLLGQNVNSYGKKLEPPVSFAQLLRQVAGLPGEFWVRFMTSHPKDCTFALIDAVAECPRVCSHLHLPVQSGSDRILREMNRSYTVADYLRIVEYARKKIPGVTFSSDIIVGFPGEREEDFEETLRLVQQVGYSNLYTFLYSPRVGTRAARMDDPVPAAEKSRWFDRLLKTQEEVTARLHGSLIGQEVLVLCEGPGRTGEGWMAGRNSANTIVEFPGGEGLVGRFVPVVIEQAHNWALVGRIREDAQIEN